MIPEDVKSFFKNKCKLTRSPAVCYWRIWWAGIKTRCFEYTSDINCDTFAHLPK